MSLIEIIELCSDMLKSGKSWDDCTERLDSMGVDRHLYDHIRFTMNDEGRLMGADGNPFVWGR